MKGILIVGATGAVGSRSLARAKSEGHWVRVLVRKESADRLAVSADDVVIGDATDSATLKGICDGIDAVLSTFGASVDLAAKETRRFRQVDTAGNANLIREAKDAQVPRFVYVGVHSGPGYAHTQYMRAHQDVVDLLASSGLSNTVVRPTGIFSAFAVMVDMARKGQLGMIGGGMARTNPISPGDVAELCIDHLFDGPKEISAGGPDILTRREIAELACEAAGKPPKAMSAPPAVAKAIGKIIGVFNSRRGELIEFLTAVATSDSVGPKVGKERLVDFFATLKSN
ncbi:MAG: SDR family oxidoreductase [Nibricoccus sp.]